MDVGSIDRPVFIVGVPRSGTTLLYRTLLRHPSFRPTKANLSESDAVDALYSLVDPSAVPAASLVNYLASSDVPDELRRAISRARVRRMAVRRLTGDLWTATPWVWRLGGEHRILRTYLALAATLRGASRILEKTPGHLWRVRHLKFAFPESQFLCIHRHPVDVLNSYWRRFRLEGESAKWANVDVDEFARVWNAGVLEADALTTAYPAAFHVLRYEDLVADPESSIRSVLDRLDEAYDPTCVETFERQAGRVFVGDEAVTAARATTWRETVSEDQAARLEGLTMRPMQRLAYQRYTPPGAPVT